MRHALLRSTPFPGKSSSASAKTDRGSNVVRPSKAMALILGSVAALASGLDAARPDATPATARLRNFSATQGHGRLLEKSANTSPRERRAFASRLRSSITPPGWVVVTKRKIVSTSRGSVLMSVRVSRRRQAQCIGSRPTDDAASSRVKNRRSKTKPETTDCLTDSTLPMGLRANTTSSGRPSSR